MGSTMNPAYEAGRLASERVGAGLKRGKDENTIENILSQAMSANDPTVLQNSIGQILSQVSPERQGPALEYLQNTYANLSKKQEQQQQFQREQQAGLVPGINATSQAAIYKEGQRGKRLGEADKIFGQSDKTYDQSDKMSGQPGTQPQPPVSGVQQPKSNQAREARKQRLLPLTGSPDIETRTRAKAELDAIEAEEKNDRADLRELKKETLPLKQNIIARADASRESIRNKSHLLDLIDKGNLNDPTFAIFAESLPFNLGKRMLSDDTVEYKGGLVDEFSDLKNIFKGATRVKEVEIYENKLADIYLDDAQKKAILKSRINTAKIDLIREEAAQEVEEKYPNITALQFNKKIDEIAKPKIEALFNSIWGEQKAVLDQAEALKQIPLDYDDPQGRQILDQIMKEAGGDRSKARQIAKKKGYTVGK